MYRYFDCNEKKVQERNEEEFGGEGDNYTFK